MVSGRRFITRPDGGAPVRAVPSGGSDARRDAVRQGIERVSEPYRICIVSGTRPEVVKLALVHAALAARPGIFAPVWIATGQHGSLADQAFADFDIKPDHTVSVATPSQDVSERVGQTVAAITPVLRSCEPHMVVVQGDTASALAGTLAASARGRPVAHVEAGLRSFDFNHPDPEESIRHLIGRIAKLHFAPTQAAVENLRLEGVHDDSIFLTGNTVVDALNSVLPTLPMWPVGVPPLEAGQRLVLVTTHRRESWGDQIAGIATAVRSVVERVPDVKVVLPVHPNPIVRTSLEKILGGHPRICLTGPLGYMDFLSLLRRAALVLTDSGGVQEEAATLGVPTLIMRKVTERNEAVDAGVARLVGTSRDDIETLAGHLLTHPVPLADMARAGNPFGDGTAGEKIATLLAQYLGAPHLVAGTKQDEPDGSGRLSAS